MTHLDPLDKVALTQILTQPKNALVKQYTKLFDMEGVKFLLKDDAIDFIIEKANDFKLGARGLRTICEAILTDAMFEIPSSQVEELVIDKNYAIEKFKSSKLSNII